MKKRTASRVIFSVLVALSGLGCSESGTDAAPERPNVVLILADDLGFGDLSLTGHASIHTPNIDRLAEDGVRFSQFYTSGSVCSPTRAGLLTGRYQQRAGIHSLIPASDLTTGIAPDEILLGEVLRDAGYATGLIGKWHLGSAPSFSPVRHGFGEFVGFLAGQIDYYTHRDVFEQPDLWRGEQAIDDPRYTTRLIEDESIAFIDAHRDEPFFLVVSHAAPHSPYQPPGEEPHQVNADGSLFFSGPGTAEIYRGMVEDFDRSVGRIVAALADRGLRERTLLIFLSDNGPTGWGSAGPLRGEKGDFFEGGIRTPMLLVWPERIAPGSVIGTPAISLDIFPTVVEAAGADLPADRVIDGLSLWPLIAGDADAHHDAIFWRQGPAELPAEVAMRQGDWKLRVAADGTPVLFDLAADPGEQEDLSTVHPETAAELEQRLRAWEREVLADSPHAASSRRKMSVAYRR